MSAKATKALEDFHTITPQLYVDDVDDVFGRAIAAGASVLMPVEDCFWGDRYGILQDPFGHRWSIATRIEDLSPRQLQERANDFNSQQPKWPKEPAK
ncbi:MAG TPA: VOC family protein [Isosphaeraceae bacterium]|nr:VOC family protein [Isosphaeraceae bacterium]